MLALFCGALQRARRWRSNVAHRCADRMRACETISKSTDATKTRCRQRDEDRDPSMGQSDFLALQCRFFALRAVRSALCVNTNLC
jgi:hypothetical protein